MKLGGGVGIINPVVEHARTRTSYVVRDPYHNIAGLALYEPRDTPEHRTPNVAWLDVLAVQPRLRGMGVGRYLIDHLVEEAASAGARAIRLRARDDERVVRFYLNNGFEIEDDQYTPFMRRDIS